jgi:hypothetical protein
VDQSEESGNDKTAKYERYLEFYFPRPSNQRDCLMEIVREAWEDGQALEEYGSDYIEDWIDIHSGEDPEYPVDKIEDKLTVYREVDRSISEDIIQFRNGLHHFLKAFYQQKASIIELIGNDDVLNNVIKVISILEVFMEKLTDTLSNYEAHLCFAMYEGSPEVLERNHGQIAVKHIKKYDELTTEEYEYAFQEITDFVSYVDKNELSGRLMELGARIRLFCELHLDKPGKEKDVGNREDQRPATLIQFMQKHCERQKLKLLKYRRKSLNDANFRESITLPEPIKDWRTGQPKYYRVSDLKQKWPDFCEILPNLPRLKQ